LQFQSAVLQESVYVWGTSTLVVLTQNLTRVLCKFSDYWLEVHHTMSWMKFSGCDVSIFRTALSLQHVFLFVSIYTNVINSKRQFFNLRSTATPTSSYWAEVLPVQDFWQSWQKSSEKV
jgi:hypothetical protein